VYLLTRDARLTLYNPDGSYAGTWGDSILAGKTHCVRFAPDGSVFTVDDGDHTVRKFSPDGQLLLTLGVPGVPADTGYDQRYRGRDTFAACSSIERAGPPFNRPTSLAIAPSGELYVSDGYANARVHRFAESGAWLASWGVPGTGPGAFNLPHGICAAPDGRILVADRENERIQIFSAQGQYVTEWTDVQRPSDVVVDREGLVYVTELAWRIGERSFASGLIEEARPGRLSVFDLDGKLLARWGGEPMCAPGNFCAPHALAVDSHGDLYVAEVTFTFAGKRGLVPQNCHSFQKFRRR